jgi:hypothetical protein
MSPIGVKKNSNGPDFVEVRCQNYFYVVHVIVHGFAGLIADLQETSSPVWD